MKVNEPDLFFFQRLVLVLACVGGLQIGGSITLLSFYPCIDSV